MAMNEAFFDEIYIKYNVLVYSNIKRILYSTVDDDITSCMQDTFIEAFKKIELLKNHQNIAGWLVITSKNVAKNFNKLYLVRNNYFADSKDMENIVNNEEFTDGVIGEIAADKVLSQLSSDERKLYELKYTIGLSNENIGKVLGITPNAVALRVGRLLKKLERFLEFEK